MRLEAFLNLSIINSFWSDNYLVSCYPVHYRIFSNIPDFYLLDTISLTVVQLWQLKLSSDIVKCSWEVKTVTAET